MFYGAGAGGNERPADPPTLWDIKASMTHPSVSHQPVLRDESVHLLCPRPGYYYIDCTLGLGSHARAILESAPGTALVAFDRDADSISLASAALSDLAPRLATHRADFKEWRRFEMPSLPFGGCLIDLGLSSYQLEGSGRGFSFLRDEPLDMRMDARAGPTAADLLNEAPREELERIFRDLGEVRFWRRLARAIVDRRRARAVRTTGDLVDAVRSVAGRGRTHHPATLPFMALRIAVNGELEGLGVFLREAASELAPGGRIVVISYHSLEDRIVKQTFRDMARGAIGYEILTKKPVVAGEDERRRNPRSRSAKLRALARTADSEGREEVAG